METKPTGYVPTPSSPSALGRVLIVGATSAIARAVAGAYAKRGYDLALVGRDTPEMEIIAADLGVRSAVAVSVHSMEALDYGHHARVLQDLLSPGDVAGVVVCMGSLGEQAVAQQDPLEARRIIETNLTAVVSLLTPVANYLEARRAGFVCVLASVAGDRGRQSNYVYGAAKGGLAIFLQGLRNRLFRAGVRVVTVKPGFVDTRMTFGMKGLFLVASPERVATDILRAVDQGRHTLYTPWFWSLIMLIIRSIPEALFKRLKL